MNSYICAYLVLGLYIIIVGTKRFKKDKLKISLISVLMIFVTLTIGARIVWFIDNERKNIQDLFALSLSYFKISGALFGGLIGLFILTKIFKEEKRNILDTVIEGMFLCAGVSKAGCFMVGCCYGKPTTLPWSVSYPEHGLYDLHPVQLYEALVWWLDFILMLALKGRMKDSTRIITGALFYILARMLILENMYVGGGFLGGKPMMYVYITAVVVCVMCIILIEKKEIKNIWKKEKKIKN